VGEKILPEAKRAFSKEKNKLGFPEKDVK